MQSTPKRDFLTLLDYSAPEIEALLRQAMRYKQERRRHPQPLKGKILGMIFEKSSTRTRVSFEVAVTELGGTVVCLDNQSSQLGRGESYADTARVLARYVDVITMRTFDHAAIEDVARHAHVPVINALTDLSHPCQLLADLLTVQEWGKAQGNIYSQAGWKDLTVVYVGDGNNMTHSWIEAAIQLQFKLVISTPPSCRCHPEYDARARQSPWIALVDDPSEAVRGAQVVTTDTWFSMGQAIAESKRSALAPYQVTASLMAQAAPNALFLHCLPAHRGEEVTDEVMDGPSSRVFDEAENRLHVQKAVLAFLLA